MTVAIPTDTSLAQRHERVAGYCQFFNPIYKINTVGLEKLGPF